MNWSKLRCALIFWTNSIHFLLSPKTKSYFIPTKPSNSKPAFRCTNEKIQNAYSWDGIDNHDARMTKIHWISCKRMHKAVGETVTQNKMHLAKPDCHKFSNEFTCSMLTARSLSSLRQFTFFVISQLCLFKRWHPMWRQFDSVQAMISCQKNVNCLLHHWWHNA